MYIVLKLILKTLLGLGVIVCSTKIGILLSKKYVYRLEELDELKNNFEIIENKIKYTYQPLEEIFYEISEISSLEIKKLFNNIAENINKKGAEEAWKDGIKKTELSIKTEDKKILQEFGNLLGKTNKEGQVNQIKFVSTLLERQIDKAKEERKKNEIVYKKLGFILGVSIVIIII